MKLYTLKNQITGEEKNFLKKNSIAKAIRVNTDKIELAVMKNEPIRTKLERTMAMILFLSMINPLYAIREQDHIPLHEKDCIVIFS